MVPRAGAVWTSWGILVKRNQSSRNAEALGRIIGLVLVVLSAGLMSCVSLQGSGGTLPANIGDQDGNDLFPDGGGPDDSSNSPDDGTTPNDGTNPDDGMVPDDGPDVGEPDDHMSNMSSDVPDIAYCANVAHWSETWATFEEDVLRLVNQRRATGADCGSNGTFSPAAALTMNPALRCAARIHSTDMGTRQFFDHTNPDGENPGVRLARAGYDASTWGENIAFGYGSPQAVVDGWMQSDGHCANIMRPNFTEIGVGYGTGDLWTQVFGAP